LKQTTTIDPLGSAEVARVQLRGDWELKIKFTYTLEKPAEV